MATRFRLVGGDQYYGKLIDGTVDDVVVDTNSCGRIKLGTEILTEIRFPIDQKSATRIRPLTPKKNKDVLYLKNGDHTYGRLEGIKKTESGFLFEWKTDSETVSFRLNEVYRLQIEPLEQRPAYDKFHLQINCWDGSSFHGRLLKYSERILWTKTLFGSERKVALSAIKSIHLKNGGFVYLTDRTPIKIEHTPFFSYKWMPRFDLNRRGGPLKLRGKTYAKGIGMQSKTLIRYDISDQPYRQFRCVIGIDDDAGDGGSVIFRVYLDGKVVKETAVQRGGAPIVLLKVPIEKAKTLALEADYADNAHVNDLADWINPILLK